MFLEVVLAELGELLGRQREPVISDDERIAAALGVPAAELESAEMLEWSSMGRMLFGLWMAANFEVQRRHLVDVDGGRKFSFVTTDITTDSEGREVAETIASVDIGSIVIPRTVSTPPMLITLDQPYQHLTVHSGRDDMDAVAKYMAELHTSLKLGSPFRGKTLTYTGGRLHVVRGHRGSRSKLIIPDRIWDEIDTNVHGFFTHVGRLAAAGLPANRGVLLVGPPGVGKTALLKVVTGELSGRATVLLPDTDAIDSDLTELYRVAADLAPCAVVLEDIDLLAAERGGHDSILQELLSVLDGSGPAHQGIVTFASTNAPDAIDPAARRACRFDLEIALPYPSPQARRSILSDLLTRVGVAYDSLDMVVDATDRFSGADMATLVTNALLTHGDRVSDEQLACLAALARERIDTINQKAKSLYC